MDSFFYHLGECFSFIKISILKKIIILLIVSQADCFSGHSIYKLQKRESGFLSLLGGMEEVALSISGTHKQKLKLLQKQRYSGEELPPLFENFSKESGELCKMYLKYKEYDPEVEARFAEGLRFKREKKEKWYDNLNSPLMAGCFNFFQMNDKSIHKTFLRVKDFIEGDKECYSVGFLQPYALHNYLGCNSLTMLDMDWRILYAHFELMEKFQKGQFMGQNLQTQEELIADLPIHWVARFDRKPVESEKQISMKTFCPSSENPYCKEIFLQFQKNFSRLQSVQFQLSYLHESQIVSEKKNIVIFTSNALDREYTGKKQLQSLLQNIAKNLSPEQAVYFIYQSGGMSNFGLYRMISSEGQPFVETICRDPYKLSAEYYYRGRSYKISMDALSTTKNPPFCQKISSDKKLR